MFHDTKRRMEKRLAARKAEEEAVKLEAAQREQQRINDNHIAEQARVLATLPEFWLRFYRPVIKQERDH